jgi:hypothetical protein
LPSVTNQVSLLWQIIEIGVMATDIDAACFFLTKRDQTKKCGGFVKINKNRHLDTAQNAVLIC